MAPPNEPSRGDAPEIIGESPAFLDCLAAIRRAAATTRPVLITGARGTGKSTLARLVHSLSAPDVSRIKVFTVDGAEQDGLVGAADGVYNVFDLRDVIVKADGGTVLVEVADRLWASHVETLRRFLGDGTVVRRDGRSHSPRARIVLDVGATGGDRGRRIDGLVADLGVLSEVVEVPPLAERHGDVRPLAWAFAAEYAAFYQLASLELEPAALHWLDRQPWPRNLWSLRNAIQPVDIKHFFSYEHVVLNVADLMAASAENARGRNPPAEE